MINEGDYVLGNYEIWEVISVHKSGLETVYDLRLLSEPGDFLEIYDYQLSEYKALTPSTELNSLTLNYIQHLGQIIPKDSQKAIEILFRNSQS